MWKDEKMFEHPSYLEIPEHFKWMQVQGFSWAEFGADNQPLSKSKKKLNFPNFQLKNKQKMDENPKFMLAGICNKNRHSKRKFIDNFAFTAHAACTTLLCVPHSNATHRCVLRMCCLWSLRRWRFFEKRKHMGPIFKNMLPFYWAHSCKTVGPKINKTASHAPCPATGTYSLCTSVV